MLPLEYFSKPIGQGTIQEGIVQGTIWCGTWIEQKAYVLLLDIGLELELGIMILLDPCHQCLTSSWLDCKVRVKILLKSL